MTLPSDHNRRFDRLLLSLDGLSVADALGQQFFLPGAYFEHFHRRSVPTGPWRYTDDTEMAISIAHVINRHGHIDQDELAEAFGRRYNNDTNRGYGGGAHGILSAIAKGESWRSVAQSAFGGQGSFGNGGAMRVAPLGAYFANDLDMVVEQAAKSAETTNAHPEGQAGAIAIAVAAAIACAIHDEELPQAQTKLIETTLDHTPDGETKHRIERALSFSFETEPTEVAGRLGNGSRVSSMDTVPFAIWCAARHLDSFSEAIWTAISVGGDI